MTIVGKRVGVVSDKPLNQSTLSKALGELGLIVSINTSPDRITKEEIEDDHISGWIIDLADEDKWADFLDELLDSANAPLLFGEGEVPAFNHDDFKRWVRRFNKKVTSLLSVSEKVKIPEVPPIPDIPLPEFKLSASDDNESSGERSEQAPSAPDLANTDASDSFPTLQTAEVTQKVELPENLIGTWKKGQPAPYVWVLGASLGGPGAVKRFLDALPEGLPVGFVYAQHIDNNFLPVLNQVLGRHSAFEMRQCSHRKKIGIGEVHIVPVNHQIKCTREEGVIFVHNRRWQGLYSPNISQVMGEFASCYGPDSGAIIFSGMGDDASIGAVNTTDAGAEVWVQKLSTCASASMPESVLATGRCTFQGTPEQLAENLVKVIASRHEGAVRIDEHTDDISSIDDPIYPF